MTTAAAVAFSTLMTALPVALPTGSTPTLDVQLRASTVRFEIHQRTDANYLGVVLISLSDQTAPPDLGLPPVLQDHTIVGFGVNNDEGAVTVDVPEQRLLPGIPIYAQGVTYDESAFRSTDVRSFVLDASAPL
ncbi:MAG: hypothetical protein ACON4Z_16035 [Planctomycetota bacterium]